MPVAVLFVQLHHLLIVEGFVVGVLFLQLIEVVLHAAHDERLFACFDALIDIEREGDRLQDERKADNADTDDADALNDGADTLTEPVQPDLISLLQQRNGDAAK